MPRVPSLGRLILSPAVCRAFALYFDHRFSNEGKLNVKLSKHGGKQKLAKPKSSFTPHVYKRKRFSITR